MQIPGDKENLPCQNSQRLLSKRKSVIQVVIFQLILSMKVS